MADKFLTEANIILEELIGTRRGSAELDTLLFPSLSITDGEDIRVDEYLSQPTVMRVARPGLPANSSPIDAGSSWVHRPPTHAERFNITPEMTGTTVAGVASTNHASATSEKFRRKVEKLFEGWLAARRKAVINLYATGKLTLFNDSADAYEEADFDRKGNFNFSWNFNTEGNTFDKAIAAAYAKTRDEGMAPSNLVLLCGRNWLKRFDTEKAVQAKALNNSQNVLIEQQMVKAGLANVEGLNVFGRYHAAGVTSPVWIVSYEPRLQFLDKVGGNKSQYIGDNAAIFFSLDNSGYRFYRGVVVNTGYNTTARVSGVLVQDTYTQPDPSTRIIRMQSRFFYAMGNVNHAVLITGSNFDSKL